MAISIAVFIKERFARELIVDELESNQDMQVSYNTGSAANLLADIARFTPAIVIIDASLCDGGCNIRTILSSYPDIVVVASGISICEQDIIPFARAGISGYIHNDASIHECSDIVRMALRSEVQSTRIAGLLNGYLHTELLKEEKMKAELLDNIKVLQPPQRQQKLEGEALTLREKEVMTHVERGFSNKEIARELGVEISTVKNHVHNILGKYHVSRRMDAAACFRASEFDTLLRPTSNGFH